MKNLVNFLFRCRRWILAGLVVLWLGALTATHTPRTDLPDMSGMPEDSILHAVGYFGLSSASFLAGVRAVFGNLACFSENNNAPITRDRCVAVFTAHFF